MTRTIKPLYSANIRNFPRISTVGIVGAGLMGVSIAAANARCGIPVCIYDANTEILRTVPERILQELDNIPNEIKRENFASLVTCGTMKDMKKCALVVECIIERVEEKRELYAKLEKIMSRDAFLVSNTSTIPIEVLSEELRFPHRFAGLHFLHPVRHRELVEVIPSTKTEEGIVQRLCDYALYIEKTPLCVADCPGFVINRLLQPYLNEALKMLQHGVPMNMVEEAACDFGMPWGPLRIMDEIGIDTVFHSGRVLFEAYPEYVTPSPIIISMVKKKLLGKKTGEGFYCWREHETASENGLLRENHLQNKMPVFNPAAEKIIHSWKTQDSLRFSVSSLKELSYRLMTAMAMEAARIVHDEVVTEKDEVDMAAVTGLGFPAHLGGPIKWLAKEIKPG
ncbi:MAG: 3-hydroxyacyl-CoA dehydrogenase family protein [Planctomycetia bacterium]|nr:3-hydroxyacyl-CoA dehydrogenase family protein [Planctomycetia bacterium]